MLGIYNDSFQDFLKENLGDPVKITNKSIICRCPWCEYDDRDKKHYHLFIYLNFPYFKCFHSTCNQKGNISKLLKKITGKDKSDSFVDPEKIKQIIIESKECKTFIKPDIPVLDESKFTQKAFYIKKRLKFSIMDLSNIKGLVFDILKFIEMNNIKVDKKFDKMKDFIQSNFIGFLTEHGSIVCLRNIDPNSEFRYYNLATYEKKLDFVDYYKIYSNSYFSNHVVLSEGIFDLYTEHIFDNVGLRNETKLYASALSTNYDSLIKSLVFNENIYKLNVSILSDRGLGLNFYKKIKNNNKHIIDKMTVYYNKTGKDFNITPVFPEKFLI